MNKIFIYARPFANMMTWAFFCKFPAVCLLQLHRARQRKNYFEQSKPLITSGLFKTFFSDTWVHLALIFSDFLEHFELFIDSYRLTGSNFAGMRRHIFDQPIGTFVSFFCALWEFCTLPGTVASSRWSLLTICCNRICSCFWLCVHRVMDALGKFGEHSKC